MNRMTKKTGRLSHGVLTTLAVTSLLFAATSARAACGSFSQLGSRSPIKSRCWQPREARRQPTPTAPTDPIVGLWHVVYTANGAVFNETLDQWHSDGTEFENAFLAPAQGNICFGVWKSTGSHSVRLHHIGWTFDPTSTGTANGTFTLDETNTVSNDCNSYTGTFTFKTFDLKGDQGMEVTGTIAATRITVS